MPFESFSFPLFVVTLILFFFLAIFQTLNEELAKLVQGFRGVANNRDSARAQLTLLKAAQEYVQVMYIILNYDGLLQ